MRAWKASVSSPGRMSVLARIPCLTALNRARSLPAAVLGPVDFWALRRFASALRRRLGVAHGGIPFASRGSRSRFSRRPGGLGEELVESRGNWRMATLCAISIGTFWAVPWTFWEFFWKSGNLRREFRDSRSDRGVTCRIPGHSEETTLDVTWGTLQHREMAGAGASVLGEHPTCAFGGLSWTVREMAGLALDRGG